MTDRVESDPLKTRFNFDREIKRFRRIDQLKEVVHKLKDLSKEKVKISRIIENVVYDCGTLNFL